MPTSASQVSHHGDTSLPDTDTGCDSLGNVDPIVNNYSASDKQNDSATSLKSVLLGSMSRSRDDNTLVSTTDTDSGDKPKQVRFAEVERRNFSASSPSAICHNFSRKGTQFKRLLDEALAKVASASTKTTSAIDPESPTDREGSSSSVDDRHIANVQTSIHILQTMVREKQTEILLLQQKVESFESETNQLKAIVEDLRETKKQQESNETRLRMALKRASQNATLARNEANEAEANASTLAKKVEALETIVQETKRVSALLLKEQAEIGAGMEGMERDYVQAQSNLIRSNATKDKLQQDQRKANKKLLEITERMKEIQDELEIEQSGRLSMKRKFEDLEERVNMEQTRSQKLQDDLDSAQSLLVDSTSATADSRHALDDCKQALERMEEANQHLHEQLQEHQSTLRKQNESHQEELARIQKDHRTTQSELNHQKENFQKLKLEKLAVDKRQESQAAKIFALERRLKESTDLMETYPSTPKHPQPDRGMAANESNGANGNTTPPNSSNTGNSFAIPRLSGGTGTTPTVTKCPICFKNAFGLMRKCECGRRDCKTRAHASCVYRVSGGTPEPGASRVPVILCGFSRTTTKTPISSKGRSSASITPY